LFCPLKIIDLPTSQKLLCPNWQGLLDCFSLGYELSKTGSHARRGRVKADIDFASNATNKIYFTNKISIF
jgi:hypothetical protein